MKSARSKLDPNAEKLSVLHTKLMAVLTRESDPDSWPGMATPQDRGDRLWCKRNAIATATLVVKLNELRLMREAYGLDLSADELGAAVAEAEKEAERLGRKVVDIRRARNGGGPR